MSVLSILHVLLGLLAVSIGLVILASARATLGIEYSDGSTSDAS